MVDARSCRGNTDENHNKVQLPAQRSRNHGRTAGGTGRGARPLGWSVRVSQR